MTITSSPATSTGQQQSPKPYDRFARSWNIIFWGTVGCLAVLLVIGAFLKPYVPDHYVHLAQNFLVGRLSVDEMTSLSSDYIPYQGHLYLQMGPTPAVVLIPFVLLTPKPNLLGVLFTALNVWIFYELCTRLNILGDRRRWMLLLFFGGTVYFSLASTMNAWYFAQVLGTTFLLLAMLAAVGWKQPVLAGLLLGFAVGARGSYAFALPFFMALFWLESAAPAWRGKLLDTVKGSALIGLGLAVPLALLLAYNYARFGDMFESGYGRAVLGFDLVKNARAYGLFSVLHIPSNLFYLFLKTPEPFPTELAPIYTFPYLQPSPMGMSVFLTTPALIYAFRTKLRSPIVIASLLGMAGVLIPLLTYHATGWITFGDRYTLDLMPFLILVVAYGFPEHLDNRTRALIILSVAINMWGSYWLHIWVAP